MRASPEELQRRYYTDTSADYDALHVSEGDEHYVALRYVSALIRGFGYSNALDVGTGTGRGMKYLMDAHPELEVRGVEPVEALVRRAVEANGVPEQAISQASGERLPFGDESFDVVMELGVLHHIERPSAVVQEMLRVARRAVFLSDDNRFGWGSWPMRVVKLALWRSGLWWAANRVRTRGRGYRLSAHDGLAYSYSVFDSLPLVADWADRVIAVPTVPQRSKSLHHPLLTADHVLLCAIRDS